MAIATNNATTPHNAESQLNALRDQVETLMHDKVTPRISAMADSAQHAATQARDSVRDGAANVSARVHENPLAAVAIAGGVGFLLGMLFRR
jgi:ElaB/YqjD/DUF883 family membrane-anchored ribosome-binding protein